MIQLFFSKTWSLGLWAFLLVAAWFGPVLPSWFEAVGLLAALVGLGAIVADSSLAPEQHIETSLPLLVRLLAGISFASAVYMFWKATMPAGFLAIMSSSAIILFFPRHASTR